MAAPSERTMRMWDIFLRRGMAEPLAPGFPIDVTFPGEGAPDPVDEWISSSARPFYRRA